MLTKRKRKSESNSFKRQTIDRDKQYKQKSAGAGYLHFGAE